MIDERPDIKKEYKLIGSSRGMKDFSYIFSDILKIVSDGQNVAIICGGDKTKFENELVKQGLKRGNDYFFDEDFFFLLDEEPVPINKKIIVWGTGKMAEYYLQTVGDESIDFFVDSFKVTDSFYGKPVFLPSEIKNWKDCYVIVAVNDNKEIISKLESLGLKNKTDYLDYRDHMKRPSFMLRCTMCDNNCFDLDCRTTLNHLEILRDGETSCCCTTFMDERLGNVYEHGAKEIWDSIRHRIINLSIQNRTYTFCKKKMCPLFVGVKFQNRGDGERDYLNMEDSAKNIVLAFDQMCNLYCDTCREMLFIPNEQYRDKMWDITKKIKREYLPGADFLVLAGDGEVFASPYYRDIFTSDESRNVKYVRLLSNGMLFNEKNWDALTAGKNVKVMLTVSVDAATKETYESIRRGGNFDILKKNMEFAASLRKSNKLSYFRLNFVVQRKNYTEMPAFVKWGEELGCDEVFFTKILNWGTYSDEEFERVSMMEKDGITPKKALLDIISNPIMQSGIVDMGTIQALHKQDVVDIVENYYMWELEKRGGKLFYR